MARRGKKPGPPRIAGEIEHPEGLGALLRAHLEALAVRGYAPRTIGGRRFYVNTFIDFCSARDITRVHDVTREVVERYQRHIFHKRTKDDRALSFRTQCELLLGVKAFCAWLVENEHLARDPAASLRLPKREKRIPRYILTHEEAERVLCVPDVSTSLGIRDRALLEVLYSTGIRRAELRGLSIDDIDHGRSTLLVRLGKGKKDRVVPIGERALAWVKKWAEDERPRYVFDDDERALFVSADGMPLSNNRLSQIVGDAIAKSGVEKKGSCHLFRHTAATLMLEAGADIRYIQAMLGHELLSTTEIYTRVAIRKLQEVHRETHPSAKLGRARAHDAHDDDDEQASS